MIDRGISFRQFVSAVTSGRFAHPLWQRQSRCLPWPDSCDALYRPQQLALLERDLARQRQLAVRIERAPESATTCPPFSGPPSTAAAYADTPAGQLPADSSSWLAELVDAPLYRQIDPLQRLAAVHDESVSAKAYLTAFGPRTGIHLLDTVPSGIMTLALRAASITGLSDASVTNNTVVTNVPGAGTSYYLAGARSVRQMSLGTLLPNVGLFQTITSQVLDNKGTLFISFVACREMLPDPAFYAQCLRDSFAALHRAARAKPVKQGKTSKKRRR